MQNSSIAEMMNRVCGRPYYPDGMKVIKEALYGNEDVIIELNDGSFVDFHFRPDLNPLIGGDGQPVTVRHISDSGDIILQKNFTDARKPIVFAALFQLLPSLNNARTLDFLPNQIGEKSRNVSVSAFIYE